MRLDAEVAEGYMEYFVVQQGKYRITTLDVLKARRMASELEKADPYGSIPFLRKFAVRSYQELIEGIADEAFTFTIQEVKNNGDA